MLRVLLAVVAVLGMSGCSTLTEAPEDRVLSVLYENVNGCDRDTATVDREEDKPAVDEVPFRHAVSIDCPQSVEGLSADVLEMDSERDARELERGVSREVFFLRSGKTCIKLSGMATDDRGREGYETFERVFKALEDEFGTN